MKCLSFHSFFRVLYIDGIHVKRKTIKNVNGLHVSLVGIRDLLAIEIN